MKNFNNSQSDPTVTVSIERDSLIGASREYFTTIFAGLEIDSHPIVDFPEHLSRATGPDAAVSSDWSRLFDPAAIATLLTTNNASPAVLFLAAFAYALAKFSGQDETVLCFQPTPNRDGILPLHLKIDEELPPAAYLAAVQSRYQETRGHHHWAFDQMAQELDLSADLRFVFKETPAATDLGHAHLALEVSPRATAMPWPCTTAVTYTKKKPSSAWPICWNGPSAVL